MSYTAVPVKRQLLSDSYDETVGDDRPQPQKIEPPAGPGEWTLAQIIEALSRPLPQSLLATRKQGGKDLTYIPWYKANKVLDKYAPGWSWEIVKMEVTDRQLFLIGSLSIPTADGLIVRSATGTENLYEADRKTGELKELAYGDASSNAESMAFRRCAARFGLGLYLYDK